MLTGQRTAMFATIAMAHIASIVFEGALMRFPRLKFAFLEYGFSWLASLMWKLDARWREFRLLYRVMTAGLGVVFLVDAVLRLVIIYGQPAAAVVEEVSGEWLKELLGIPATASFGFVTGAQGANTVGLPITNTICTAIATV